MRNGVNPPTRLPILSQTAEHALRAVLYLGRQERDGYTSAQDVSDALGTPANYLSKTLRLLARRGILSSVRGPAGGFMLARSPESLTPAEIIAAVDDAHAPARCLMGDRPCDPAHACAMHARWSGLGDQILQPLWNTTIADLLSDVRQGRPATLGDPSHGRSIAVDRPGA